MQPLVCQAVCTCLLLQPCGEFTPQLPLYAMTTLKEAAVTVHVMHLLRVALPLLQFQLCHWVSLMP